MQSVYHIRRCKIAFQKASKQKKLIKQAEEIDDLFVRTCTPEEMHENVIQCHISGIRDYRLVVHPLHDFAVVDMQVYTSTESNCTCLLLAFRFEHSLFVVFAGVKPLFVVQELT